MLEALEASSLHGFQCDRQLRLELYPANLCIGVGRPVWTMLRVFVHR